MSRKIHVKCRNTDKPYAKTDMYRAKVPDDKVDWLVDWNDYSPPDFTSPSLKNKPYADKDISVGTFKWNQMDGMINRCSHQGIYKVADDGRPQNPEGRTGLKGRGVLGRWGPNHAADCLVSRVYNNKLQFLAIQRRDSGNWAIPGGMVDSGETPFQAARREFVEEAMDGAFNNDPTSLWKKGVELYRGYVDDPRNTDNSWMETVVFNFHDDSGILESVKLKAGDDATNICWLDADPLKKTLHASHEEFINLLVKHHQK